MDQFSEDWFLCHITWYKAVLTSQLPLSLSHPNFVHKSIAIRGVNISSSIIKYFFIYPILTRKMAAFLTCRAVRKRGNARPYSQSRKKSEERRCKKRGNARPYGQSRKKSEERRCKNRKILLGRILKVEKKVKRSVVRIWLGRLWLFGNGKSRLLFSVVFGMQS